MNEPFDALRRALADRYEIEDALGHGGMATVWRARDLRHQRTVAIKVLKPELTTAIGATRFQREIQIAARLHHPHILTVHDSGEAGGLLYYVMPYVEGESLRDTLVRKKQLPVDEALAIARQVAEALDYAHGQSVVHRDIKPENIMLVGDHAWVADFGIARALGDGDARLTETGLAVGTPAYMSPEQVLPGGAVDRRSDLYSLACVVYEMLAGQPPFTGATPEAIVHQQLSVEPRGVRTLRPAVHPGVESAIGRALSKTAADRFDTVAVFATALDEAQASPVPVPRPRRRAWTVAAVAMVVLAGAAWAIRAVFYAPMPAPAATRDWIMVADFEGPPGDSVVAEMAHDLMVAALDQSTIIAPLPPSQVRIALQMAGKPADTPIDAELARELAYRRAVRGVLEGQVHRAGSGYSIIVRVVDADSAGVLQSMTRTAKNDEALIPTLGDLADDMRRALGERHEAVKASRPLVEAMTPSFEAYRTFVHASQLLRQNWNPEAIPLFHDALALDPDFASAWSGIGTAYANLGIPDSALHYWKEAMARPNRLLPQQRYRLESTVASWNGDDEGALRAIDQALVYDPGSPTLLHVRGSMLEGLGREKDALESYRDARARLPFGPSDAMLWNEVTALLEVGRLDDARELAEQMRSESRWKKLVECAIAAEQWAVAESLGTAISDMDIGTDYRATGLLAVAAVRAAHGALGASVAAFRRARHVASDGYAPIEKSQAERCLVLLTAIEGDPKLIGSGEFVGDSANDVLTTRAWQAVIAGDMESAEAMSRTLHDLPPIELARDGAVPLLDAWMAAGRGSWRDAAHLAEPLALRQREPSTVIYPVAETPARWLLAEAYDHLGEADSVAHILELAVGDPRRPSDDQPYRATAGPFMHRMLAWTYLKLGKPDLAKRHFEAFAAMMTKPDPQVQQEVEELRGALASAAAMRSSP